ncbi:hypothetical protein V8C34DRAFT_324007 [Trichoderma compactum]
MGCTCIPQQGCCSEHNSLQTPNQTPLEQSSISCDMPERISTNSTFTLKPMHSAMKYHLSFDNLSCIRNRLSSEAEKVFIPELSIAGSAASDQGTQYRWTSEIYFDKGTFLQKQEIVTGFYETGEYPPEHFIGCPHQSLSIFTPEFIDRDGMCGVEAWVMSKPSRCTSHPMQKWNSFQGPYIHITSCTICYSDTECHIQLYGPWLHMRYTCFRDLGAGIDSTDPKWLSLLTGDGITHRPHFEFEVFTHVWHTALDLKRSGLQEVTHKTPNGIFHFAIMGKLY